VEPIRIPELDAHAAGLPHLRYVLADPIDAILLEVRHADSDKQSKDIEQASVLFAFMSEDAPDAIEESFAAIPKSVRSKTVRGAKRVLSRD
jgi:hypothetical protein